MIYFKRLEMKKIFASILSFLLAVGSISGQTIGTSDYILQKELYGKYPDAQNYALELYTFLCEKIKPNSVAEDEMCQALALANNWIYSISDDETKLAIKKDIIAHYALYQKVKDYQKTFKIKLDIDGLPLLAKAIWAYRIHGTIETAPAQNKLTIDYYNEFVDKIDSYNYLFSRLKKEHFENFYSLESIAQSMEAKIRDTADFYYVNAYGNDIRYEDYFGKSRRWDQFAWLNYQVGLYKAMGKARGDCVTACLLQIAYYKLMGIPAFAEQISTVTSNVYSHNSPRHYNPYTNTWVAAQMPVKHDNGYYVYFLRPKLHHQFLVEYPRPYYNTDNPGQFVDYDQIVSNRRLGFTDADIETMMFHKVKDESQNEFWVSENNCQIPLTDSDKDGLYDIWEKRFGTDVNQIDTDGDGLSDLFEIQSDKNPLDEKDISGVTSVVIDGITDFEKDLPEIVSASDAADDYTSDGEIHDVNMIYAKNEGNNLYVGVSYHNDIRINTRQIRTLTVVCLKNNVRQQEIRFQWVDGCKCNIYRNNFDTLIATDFIPMKCITSTEMLIPRRYFGDADRLSIQYRATGTINGKSTNAADYSGVVELDNEPINEENNNDDDEISDDETSVTEQLTNINIYTLGKTIVVENATDDIFVYDAMGKLVGRDVARNVSTITVNDSGVYIVKIGDVAKKVFVW